MGLGYELRIMVCVTLQKRCKRLIDIGSNIVSIEGGELFIVHLTREKENLFSDHRQGEVLEYLFQASEEAGVEMTVLQTNNILYKIVDFAQRNKITFMILGDSLQPYKETSNIIDELKYYLPQVEIMVIT